MAKTRREEWRDSAKCKKQPLETFFFETENGRYSTRKIQLAREFCSGCDVQIECLSYALNENIEHGIWGGFSSRERNTIKRIHKVVDYSDVAPYLINKPLKIIKNSNIN